MGEYSLFTGRLLRFAPPTSEDHAVIARWMQDTDYQRMMEDDPIRPLSVEQVAAFNSGLSSDSFDFHLRTLADGTLIGFVALFDIKWKNGTSMMAMGIGEAAYRGKGYGSDALRLLLGYAFRELNLYRVGLNVIAYNAPAIRAYERAGFQLEGRRRGMVYRDGERHDLLQYGILRAEWAGR
ncbi:MAG: GNAT family N-acetyltransferase [Anaerolineaceae bacterium]|nr:GNAT family N-acetyltransferase [Anaerolineaceae bacterium]